jgi:pimeloyl-ACP methyl ester carboxylesterase
MAGPIKNRSVLHWLGRVLCAFILIVLLLAAIGATYESLESSRDRPAQPPPGQLIDVGGHKMHLVCSGQGAPTVLLESGLWDDWRVWHKVQPAISKLTQVCSYDRAGLGFSDLRPEQQPDSRDIAHNLHTLLANARVNPPYVLVGHSLGGLHIRVFQSLYPEEVVGMVLVDSGHPDQESRVSPEMKKIQAHLYLRSKLWGLAVPLGLPRLMGRCGRTIECKSQTIKAREAEVNAIGASSNEARETRSLGSIPLVVLSRDPEKGAAPGLIPAEVSRRFEDEWVQMQEELARLSTNGSRVVAIGSSHYVQLERPDLVIAAISKVVDVVSRTSNSKSLGSTNSSVIYRLAGTNRPGPTNSSYR